MKNYGRGLVALAGAVAITTALGVGSAEAGGQGKKNTTKASIGVVALCDLSSTILVVDLEFTEESSGGLPGAEVRTWTVQGLQKKKNNWDNATYVVAVQTSGAVELDPDGLLVEVPDIELCGGANPLMAGAKAVNAEITIIYGSADPICDLDDPDPDLCADRPAITMNCSPNPLRDGQGGVSVAGIVCP